jgi:hypothetical protein
MWCGARISDRTVEVFDVAYQSRFGLAVEPVKYRALIFRTGA